LLGGYLRRIAIEGFPDNEPERRPEVTMVAVTPGYFETLGIRLTRGRVFNASDGTPGHGSVIVNQRFVEMHLSGQDPIGRQITLYDPFPGTQSSPPRTATIIGLAPNIRQRSTWDPAADPVAYLPFEAESQRSLTLMVKSPEAPERLTPLLREEMRRIEPDLPLFDVRTLDRLVAETRWPQRVFGIMFTAFALMALVLSAVGLYAVTAYGVTQRLPELGVRIALGAQPPHIWWLVLRRSLVQLAIGLPIGIAGAFAVGRVMQSILVRTSPSDPLTLASIALVMIVVSVAASAWPARRATRIDPLTALR
jgi:hypothetical protein